MLKTVNNAMIKSLCDNFHKILQSKEPLNLIVTSKRVKDRVLTLVSISVYRSNQK